MKNTTPWAVRAVSRLLVMVMAVLISLAPAAQSFAQAVDPVSRGLAAKAVTRTDPASTSGTAYKPFVEKKTIIAGYRYQYQRRQSAAAPGFNIMSVRWHMSPPVAIDGLQAVWSATYQDATNGLQPIGNDLTCSAAIMYPVASAPGAAKAFKKAGAYQVTVPNGATVKSDVLSVYLPANTPYRLRSWCQPGASGYIPYGMPGLGQSNGALSGFAAGANDQNAYANGQTDQTQTSTSVATNATSDTIYEPMIIGRPIGDVSVYAILADSWGYGATEVGNGGGATTANAGDAYGNVGIYARAIALNGDLYNNFGISGSRLSTWVADGYSSDIFATASDSANAAIIALGINDELGGDANTIVANLQIMVNKARAQFASKVFIATLPPRVNSGGTYSTLVGQTVDSSRQPVIVAVNALIRAGAITGASVIDVNAMVADPTQTDKYRVDQGAITDDGTHLNNAGIAFIAPLVAAAMRQISTNDIPPPANDNDQVVYEQAA